MMMKMMMMKKKKKKKKKKTAYVKNVSKVSVEPLPLKIVSKVRVKPPCR